MSDQKLKSAPLAYQNGTFLNSPDGRILRLLSEYSEPLSRFRREQIQDTVVFFGSARIHSQEIAANRLTEVRGNGAQISAAHQSMEMKRAEAAVDMARYYEDAELKTRILPPPALSGRMLPSGPEGSEVARDGDCQGDADIAG